MAHKKINYILDQSFKPTYNGHLSNKTLEFLAKSAAFYYIYSKTTNETLDLKQFVRHLQTVGIQNTIDILCLLLIKILKNSKNSKMNKK